MFNVRPICTEEWIQFLAGDSVFFHAGAQAMQLTYDSVVNPVVDSRSNPVPSVEVLRHRCKALHALRAEFQKGQVTDAMLLSLQFLAFTEKTFGDLTAFDTHMRMLRALVAARGGLTGLGEYVRCLLLHGDFFWAMRSGVSFLPTTNVRRTPDYRPLPAQLRQHSKRLPEGFRALINASKLPLDVVEVLVRINDVHCKGTRQYILSTKDVLSSHHRSDQYSDFWEACPSMFAADRNLEPAIEKLLCLAMFLFCTSCLSPLAAWSGTPARTVLTMTENLVRCISRRDSIEENCLFWIWSLTVLSCKTRKGDLMLHGCRLRQDLFLRFPAWASYEEARPIWETFFYTESLGALFESG